MQSIEIVTLWIEKRCFYSIAVGIYLALYDICTIAYRFLNFTNSKGYIYKMVLFKYLCLS